MPSGSDLSLHRSFRWGIVIIGDARNGGVLERPPTGVQIAATRSALVLLVRHGDDVDLPDGSQPDDLIESFNVDVSVQLGPCFDGTDIAFDGTIEIASGLLSVGDAEDEAVLELPASGQWRVQIAMSPSRHAEEIGVWLNPVSDASVAL